MRKNWKMWYGVLLLCSALYYDRAFCADGQFPLMARDSDGYSVVDLDEAKASTWGRISIDKLTVGGLTVLTSATLPATGTVPIHSIADYHDTSATGAQLNTLVGGTASDASTLHNHTSFSGNLTVPYGSVTVGSVGSTGGGLTLVNGPLTFGNDVHTGTVAVPGSSGTEEYMRWGCNDNASNSDVLDSTWHFKGAAYVNGVLANTSSLTTTTAVLGGRAFSLTGYAGNKEQIIFYPTNQLTNTMQDFTVSFWHKPRKSALAVTEYPMHANSYFYISLSPAGRYYCAMVPTGGATYYVSSAAGFYDNQFHLITFGRSGTTLFFYVDGVLVNSTTNSTFNLPMIFGLRFGGGYPSTGMGRGVIDDVRLFRYGLTPGQIQALYNSRSGTISSTLAVTAIDGALNLPSRSGYAAELRNEGNSAAYKGLKILAGENTATANNEMLGCFEGDGDQRGAIVIDSSRNVAIWNVSDRAVKKNIRETQKDIMGVIGKAKVYDYNLRDTGTKGFGFVAQELAAVVPGASAPLEIEEMRTTSETLGVVAADHGSTVTLTSGRVVNKTDPSIKIEGTQAVRYGKVSARVVRQGVIQTTLIPYLWRAIQIQQEQLTALSARVATLEKARLQ